MQQQDILDAVHAAEDKNQLEALGRDLLGVALDKRKGLKTLRAQLLAVVAEQAEDAVSAADTEMATLKPRLLLNTMNGRTFVYTEALARLQHMVDVEA